MRLILPVVAALMLFLLPALACNDTDDDDDHDVDDDDDNTADDDTGDDDTLVLPEYEGDGHLYGIALGDPMQLLSEGQWTSFDTQLGYDNCEAIDVNNFVLVSGNGKVHLLTNRNLIDLDFDRDLGYISVSPISFFTPDFGYIGRHCYESGIWSFSGYLDHDFLAPDDGIALTEDRSCLVHYDGDQAETITCLEDHPLNADVKGEEYLFFRQPQYLGPDDIWIFLYDDYEHPGYFSHWDGAQWNQTLLMATWHENESWRLQWDFTDEDHGWALLYQAHDEDGRSTLWRFEYGQWTEVEHQQPFGQNRCVPDHCRNLSVVSGDEAWLICRYRVYDNFDYPLGSFYYFRQILNNENFFWQLERRPGHGARWLDINLLE